MWFPSGQTFKVVFAPSTDTDPPSSPYWTKDNLPGINDTTATQSEWITGPTPTYVSATQFTLAGDQTGTFTKRRRLKFSVTAGTVYGTIVSSSFGALTTVNVSFDSGSLDSGLSAVSYSVIPPSSNSLNADYINKQSATVSAASTTDVWGISGNSAHVNSTGPIGGFSSTPYAGAVREIIFDTSVGLINNATTLALPGGVNCTTAPGDVLRIYADGSSSTKVLQIQRANGLPPIEATAVASFKNLTVSTDASTTTKLRIAFEEAILKDSSNWGLIARSTTLSADFTANGVNGLDAGSVVTQQWYYPYIIAKPDGTIASVLSSSQVAPNMSSAALSAYTFKALASAARVSATTTFAKYTQRGNEITYEAAQNILATGSYPTSESTASYAAQVAPLATMLRANVWGSIASNGGGAVDTNFRMRWVSGSNFMTYRAMCPNSGRVVINGDAEIPANTSAVLFYLWDNVTNGSADTYNIDIVGFKLPIGGE